MYYPQAVVGMAVGVEVAGRWRSAEAMDANSLGGRAFTADESRIENAPASLRLARNTNNNASQDDETRHAGKNSSRARAAHHAADDRPRTHG